MRHLILRHVTAFIVIVTSIVAVSCIKNSKPQQTIPSDDEERVYMLVATPGAEGDFTRAVAVSDRFALSITNRIDRPQSASTA